MERALWKIFQNPHRQDLEGRLFYAILTTSAIGLFILGLITSVWPEKNLPYSLFGLGLFFILLFQSFRINRDVLIYIQWFYMLGAISCSIYIFPYTNGLNGPVVYGLLLSFLVLLTTSTSIKFQRLVFAFYAIAMGYFIFYASSGIFDLELQIITATISVTLILIFYLGSVYLKSTYDRLAIRLRKQRDELERKNQDYREQVHSISELNAQKTRLFSIIGHDLRSPLSGIEGLLHLLELDENQSEDQKVMQRDLLRLTRNSRTLLDNLLYWSKRESNAYQPSLVNYPDIIQMVSDYLAPIAASKNVKLQMLIEPNEGQIWNDAQMLEMIIRNLVQNAIKFVEPGGWVKLRAYETEKHLLLEVEDNGIGMTKEQIEKLFSDQREVRRGTSQEKGVGLGLKLCNEFVAKMDGSIKLRSIENKGTCFIIQLPRTKEDTLLA